MQRTMLELLNQLDGFSSNEKIKVNEKNIRTSSITLIIVVGAVTPEASFVPQSVILFMLFVPTSE